MGEFRIGRRFAQHSYPDTPRPAPASLARNFAARISNPLALPSPGPTTVIWPNVEVGVAPLTEIPITPHATGIILVTCSLQVQNGNGVDANVEPEVFFTTAPNPPNLVAVYESTVAPTVAVIGNETVTFIAEFGGLPLGVTSTISIRIICPNAALKLVTAEIEIEELLPATG